jgi:serine/threonine protein kinase
MELCDARTLKDYLAERDRARGGAAVDEVRSTECLVQILQGLEHVHGCGLVHRDLKPANCCFNAQGTLKLMDFGLSKPTEAEPTAAAAGGSGGTTTIVDLLHKAARNTVGAGTPSYAAPEQMSGGAALAACDMFPLGLMTYELFHVFGSAMERAKDFGDLREGRVPAPFAHERPALAALIRRLLSKRPQDRPLCREVLRAIQSPPFSVPEVRSASPDPSPDASPRITPLSGGAVSPEPSLETSPRIDAVGGRLAGAPASRATPVLAPSSLFEPPMLLGASIVDGASQSDEEATSEASSPRISSWDERNTPPLHPLPPPALLDVPGLEGVTLATSSGRVSPPERLIVKCAPPTPAVTLQANEEVFRQRIEMRLLAAELAHAESS